MYPLYSVFFRCTLTDPSGDAPGLGVPADVISDFKRAFTLRSPCDRGDPGSLAHLKNGKAPLAPCSVQWIDCPGPSPMQSTADGTQD